MRAYRLGPIIPPAVRCHGGLRLLPAVLLFLLALALPAPAGPRQASRAPLALPGDGTPEDPYLVATLADLDLMRENLAASYRLTADIDAAPTAAWHEGAGWEPVGDPDGPGFSGRLDGAGHRVSDLTIGRPEADGVGLFAFLEEGGRVENLHLDNVMIMGNHRVGSLAGRSAGEIVNCAADGLVRAIEGRPQYLGGLVGFNAGPITGSSFTGVTVGVDYVGGLAGRSENAALADCDVEAAVSGIYHVGGLAGYNLHGPISRCRSAGTVDGISAVGGLVGENIFGTVSDSSSTAEVEGNINVGGLVGRNDRALVTGCRADGRVIAVSRAGGLVGLNSQGEISDGLATGAVTAGNESAGGLVGDNRGEISESEARGAVSAFSRAGGLVGSNYSRVSDSRSSGAVTLTGATGNHPSGGLAGENHGEIVRCYATGSVEGKDFVGGLAGRNFEGALISECRATGAVSGGSWVGGLAGKNRGEIERCYATGNAVGGMSVGGLVGENRFGFVRDSYATGSAHGTIHYIGGLVGSTLGDENLVRVYSSGAVSGTDAAIGGLVGFNWGYEDAVTDGYWDRDSSGQKESAGGTGLSGDQALRQDSYAGWDFSGTWAIAEGRTRPWLRALPPPPAAPILSPARPGTLAAGDTLRFRGGPAAVPVDGYRWDFGDGREASAREPGPVNFPDAGEFIVEYTTVSGGEPHPAPDTRRFEVVERPEPWPDLVAVSLEAAGTPAIGEDLSVSWTVRNEGADLAAEAAWTDALYLSRHRHPAAGDIPLAARAGAGPLAAGESYAVELEAPLPPLAEGAWYLLLVVNDEWSFVEKHRLNNERALQFDLALPLLEPGVPGHFEFPAGPVEHYLRLDVLPGHNLRLDFAAPYGLEFFLRRGALPTPSEHDHFSAGEEIFIPGATAGAWYLLVRGRHQPEDGAYTVTATLPAIAVQSVAPVVHPAADPLELLIAGAGFAPPLQAALLVPGGDAFHADELVIHSAGEISAHFAAGRLPAGQYDLRLEHPEAGAAVYPGALEVIDEPGEAAFEKNLVLPPVLGYLSPAVIYIEYENTGTAPMNAPLLRLTAEQNGRQGAKLTLDRARLGGALWTRFRLPEGFYGRLEFLASGEYPGLLLPGERRRLPVYYAGWLMPWDPALPPFTWRLDVLGADEAKAIDWESRREAMRPEGVGEEAWEALWPLFTARAGATWGGFVAALARASAYLHRLGQRVDDAAALQSFLLLKADDLGPLPVIPAGADARREVPGEVALSFERLRLQRLSQRFEIGPLGRGWAHNWQFTLSGEPGGTRIVTEPGGYRRLFLPDSRGQDRFVTAPGEYGVLEAMPGGRWQLAEKDGRRLVFEAGGRLDYIEDRNGNRVTCEYFGVSDMLTGLVHSAGPRLDIGWDEQRGLVTSAGDGQGRETTFEYDDDYYLVAAVAFDGRRTGYEYKPAGGAAARALAALVRPDGTRLVFGYDQQGRLSSLAREVDGEPVEALEFAHDRGAVEVSNAAGLISRLFYDHLGRLAALENAAGERVRHGFDERGDLASITGPDGFASTLSRDLRGNLSALADQLGETIRFEHDQSFNLPASLTDPAGHRTRYERDERGNLKAVALPDGSRESWTYDAAGNPLTWRNRRGQEVAFTHDASGRLTGKTLPGGEAVLYDYDALGRLERMVDSTGETVFTWDGDDRLTRVDYPGGRWLEFTWDAAGRRTGLEDQSGRRLVYHYGPGERLARVVDGDDTEIVAWEYDAVGRPSRRTLGNGVYSIYGYDASGRLAGLVTRDQGGEIISRFEYLYDRRGRRTAAETHYGAWAFEYDDAHRLVRAVLDPAEGAPVPARDIAWEYDERGNRTRVVTDGVPADYSVDRLNRYGAAGDLALEWDLDGNLVRSTGPGGVTEYGYDALNRLASVSTPGGEWAFTYDGFGLPAIIHENGAVSRRLVHDPLDRDALVGEYDAAGAAVAAYLHGGGPIARAAPGSTPRYYTFDPLGGVAELTGPAGEPLNSYIFGPFGEILHSDEAIETPLGFLGQVGAATGPGGLVRAGARHYMPALGRFIQADPAGIRGGLNLYAYAFNNPVGMIDETGLLARSAAEGAWAGVSAGFVPLDPSIMGAAPDAIRAVDSMAETNSQLREMSEMTGVRLPQAYGNPFDNARRRDSRRDREAGRRRPFRPRSRPAAAPPYRPGTPRDVPAGGSLDPNQKLAPAGHGPGNHLAVQEIFTYRVDFENLPEATAPAQVVTVRDPLSEKLDWATFELTEFGFGDVIVTLEEGTRRFGRLLDYRYADDEYDFEIEVLVEADFNAETGLVSVDFFSRDPHCEFGLPPPVNVGFLPPENETGRGQGYIAYRVRPRADLPGGSAIRNVATIQFDYGLKIDTNQVDPLDKGQGTCPDLEALATIDDGPPTSAVNPLPPESIALFEVTWSGEDGPGNSGVAGYDIFVREDGGAWSTWRAGTPEESDFFSGTVGRSYDFYSIAVDLVGQREDKDPLVEATTLVTAASLPGDINADGRVDMEDLVLLLGHLGGSAPLAPEQLEAADVNDDDRVDIGDAMLILRLVLGLPIDPPD